jgi:hypothetical protein
MPPILQPNFEKVGRMRLWPWEFVAWAGREWNLVQDAYWWNFGYLPSACARGGSWASDPEGVVGAPAEAKTGLAFHRPMAHRLHVRVGRGLL